MTTSAAVPGPAEPGLVLAPRVRLAHACIARHLDEAGLRGLHVKGYAAAPGTYAPDRSSSDVDLLVHPEDAGRACDVLAAHGWARVADFSEGSIFEHAATLWHDHLGYVDVHRLFPGLGSDPAAVFEHLWRERTVRVISGRPVPVPSLDGQRLVVVVHAARDGGRGRADVRHLRDTLSPAEWDRLRTLAAVLDAEAAWDVATGEDLAPEGTAESELFAALRSHASGADLLAARWRAAGTVRERAALILHVLPVNRPHLQMRLGRPVTWRDVLREQASRVGAGLAWARGKTMRRGR